MINKLENPQRVAELNPSQTLRNIGLNQTDTFCDIGAGSGLFTFAAAGITGGTVYAVDTSDAMQSILLERNTYPNVIINGTIEEVPDTSTDMALLCTVLHELDNAPVMLREIRQILKQGGRLAVIEFHKKDTPMGPPPSHRIGEDKVISLAESAGFSLCKRAVLGDNFYLLVFEVL